MQIVFALANEQWDEMDVEHFGTNAHTRGISLLSGFSMKTKSCDARKILKFFLNHANKYQKTTQACQQ